jgi:dolichol-phosphate mannosyltransferase
LPTNQASPGLRKARCEVSVDTAVTILVPTYNERDNVIPLVRRIDGALAGRSYQVVFVDDDSKDGTAQVAAALSPEYPVRVIVRRDKRGLASAIVDGIKETTGQIIGVMDADLQHPPETLPLLLDEIENGADIAIASRYIKGSGLQGWALARRVISRGASFLARMLLPFIRPVKDPLSGFFVFKRQVVAHANLRPTGYKILLEILTEGESAKLTEVPYTFVARNAGQSKLNIFQEIDYLKHVYSLMKRRGELFRMVKFALVGLSGVGVNIGILYWLTESAGLFYLASAAIAIEASIISNFSLNNYFTFADRRAPGIKGFFRQLGKFNLVSLLGLAINAAVLVLFTETFGVYYIFSQLFGIAMATAWNYLGDIWWTWK